MIFALYCLIIDTFYHFLAFYFVIFYCSSNNSSYLCSGFQKESKNEKLISICHNTTDYTDTTWNTTLAASVWW